MFSLKEKTLASMPLKFFIEFFFPFPTYLWKTEEEGYINAKEKNKSISGFKNSNFSTS